MWDVELCAWKALIAVAACVYLLREGRTVGRKARLRAAHLVLAAAACGAYFHFGDLPFKGFFHRWEMFHYYLGAKYTDELGYKNLYRCVAVADAQTGAHDSAARRSVRDLETDGLVPASRALAEPAVCTARFSAERWDEFRTDVTWFRSAAGDIEWWEAMQQDHGYNAPPAFSLLARPLTELSPLGSTALVLLASLDLVLMTGIVLLLRWAFGGRVAAIAVVFWGTQAASEFFWTGGAFLRQDWLFFAVLSLALARKNRPFLAGTALAAAAALRIFPVLFFAGPFIAFVAARLREHGTATPHARFLAGGALALVLFSATSAALAGPEDLRDFATRVELRATSQVANHMGLRTLFSASPATRPEHASDERSPEAGERWDAARSERLRALTPLYALAAAAAIAFWVRAVAGIRTLWIALALGVALVPMLAEPATYYYSFALLAVPLTRVLRSLEVALLGLAGAGQLVALRFAPTDEHFFWLAVLYVAFALAASAAFARRLAPAGFGTTEPSPITRRRS